MPEYGGDAIWANMVVAYEDLIEPLREMADRMCALHTNNVDFDMVFAQSLRSRVKAFARTRGMPLFETDDPLVRVHPKTGERVLLIGTCQAEHQAGREKVSVRARGVISGGD